MEMEKKATIGLVGARGYVGRELVKLLLQHPRFEIAFVVSRTQAGDPIGKHIPEAGDLALAFEDLSPIGVAEKRADAVILALPNDQSHPVVGAIDSLSPRSVVVDVSADHRFSDAWIYGLPELFRDRLAGARRIANPGCYATAAALAVAPLKDLLDAPAQVFGVSGYSGAGTTPSPRNDPEQLRDNLMPYSLTGHTHEQEVSRHVAPVSLMPHVAPFFRGITATVAFSFREPISQADLRARYASAYGNEPLIHLVDTLPLVRDIAGRPDVMIGGLAAQPERRRAVVVVTLDNLLKGAASQALQNLNLAFGFPERMGIEP